MIKKLLLVALFLILTALGSLWYLGTRVAEQGALSTRSQVEQVDTDGDGLKDWEEELWQTMVNKADTDGDGTTDGQEVERRRDPSRAGPNDELEDSYKQATAQLRNTIITTEVPVLNVEPGDVALPSTQYTPADLHITLNDTLADTTKYANAYRQIIADYTASTTANVPQLLFTYLEDGNQAKLAEINSIKVVSASTVRRLAALDITLGGTYWHLNLLNNLAGLTELIYNISQADTIPSLALASAQLYPSRYLLVVKSLLAMNKYFTDQKVKFTDGPVPLILINNF